MLSYTVHLPKDKQILYPNPILYGLGDEEIQNAINDAMAVLLQERIDADSVLINLKSGEVRAFDYLPSDDICNERIERGGRRF